MGIQWEKSNILWKSMRTNFSGSPHTMGFVGFSREQISQAFPIQWILLPFPMLWEIDEKTNVFPILWSIPQEKYLMGKSSLRNQCEKIVWTLVIKNLIECAEFSAPPLLLLEFRI